MIGAGSSQSWGVGPDPFAPCAFCGHDPKHVTLDAAVWTRIVFAAKESDDWKLRTLIEQAVMGPVRRPS